jgi:periplasmic glucans biosynthesis protein
MLRRALLTSGLLGALVLALALAGYFTGLISGFGPGDSRESSRGSGPAPSPASEVQAREAAVGSEGPRVSAETRPSPEAVGREVADWLVTSASRGSAFREESLPSLLLERAREREPEGTPLSPRLRELLTGLSYDEYRDIQFRHDASLWKDEGPFRLQFFHPGSIHTDQVHIYRVEGEAVQAVRFETALFDYRQQTDVERRLRGAELGLAGFRVNHPLNTPGVWDEVAVFLGGSYFRLLGRGHVYGISGRGVAVNTTLIGAEEFPVFREFWVVQPPEDAEGLHFFARLDGASVTGAYHFHLLPGSPTVMEVEAHLFVHSRVEELGLAPLTSMFLTAPATGPAVDDFRPRIHDSDGLLVHTGEGEWIWRPLSNGPGLRISTHDDVNPRGFGLLQRNRDFGAYLDLEARYHDRPSLWVEVGEGDWGRGAVRLMELPTASEFEDNIVAFWAPEGGAQAGDEVRLRYRLVAFDDRLPTQTLAQVAETRIGSAQLPGASPSPMDRARRFVVDFHPLAAPAQEGAPAARAVPPPSLEGVEVLYRASSGRVSDVRAELLPGGAGWRATFLLEPRGEEGAELGLALRKDGVPLTETWSYHWQPRAPDRP